MCSLLFSDTIDVLFTVHNSGTFYTYRACRIVGTCVRKSFVLPLYNYTFTGLVSLLLHPT